MGLRRNLLVISVLAMLVGSHAATAQNRHFRVPTTRVCFPPVRIFSGCDVAFSSAYVWRGITRRNAPVIQPDIFTTLEWSPRTPARFPPSRYGGFLTVGGWANIEIDKADSTQPTEVGLGRRVGESNLWVQVEVFWGQAFDLTLGYTRYIAHTRDAAGVRSDAYDTGELYGALQFDVTWGVGVPGGAVSLRLPAWLDHEDVGGLYFEPVLDIQLPFFPLLSMWAPSPFPALQLRAAVGISSGQSVDPLTGRGYFQEDGLTHADFSAATTFLIAGRFSAAAEYHRQRNYDDRTRRFLENGTRDPNDNWKNWIRFFVSWVP